MNILIFYFNRHYPIRTALADHLHSVERYSGARCFYVNLAHPTTPKAIKNTDFDLVVFHSTMLWWRYEPGLFEKICRRADWAANLPCRKVILPQDEHLQGKLLHQLIERFNITTVFSLASEDQWPLLYPEVDLSKVRFHRVLPGYLADSTLERIQRMAEKPVARDLDLGYRAVLLGPSLGRHALLKATIGRAFAEKSEQLGLKTDISNDIADTFLGDAWFEFLLRCKYTVGVEGGASILDYDGSVLRQVSEYLAAHPGADFDEVEEHVFPSRDGEIAYHAISPRHLECCATKTCQILVEGEYNGILEPNTHYIELKRDFSNLDEVMQHVVDDDLREGITQRAYDDVVLSGRWSYQAYVSEFLELAFEGEAVPDRPASQADERALAVARRHDRRIWIMWAILWSVRRPMERVIGRNRLRGWVTSVRRMFGELE